MFDPKMLHHGLVYIHNTLGLIIGHFSLFKINSLIDLLIAHREGLEAWDEDQLHFENEERVQPWQQQTVDSVPGPWENRPGVPMGPRPVRNRDPIVIDSREYKQNLPQIVTKYQGEGNFHQNWKPGAMVYQPPAQPDNFKDPTLHLMDMSKVDEDFFKANQDVWELFQKYGAGTPKFYVYNDNRSRKRDKHLSLLYTPNGKTNSLRRLVSEPQFASTYQLANQPQLDESEESEESQEEETEISLLPVKNINRVGVGSRPLQLPKVQANGVRAFRFYDPQPFLNPDFITQFPPNDVPYLLSLPAEQAVNRNFRRKAFRWLEDTVSPKRQQPKKPAFFLPNPKRETQNPKDKTTIFNLPALSREPLNLNPDDSTLLQDPPSVSLLNPGPDFNLRRENTDDVTNILHLPLEPRPEQPIFISNNPKNQLRPNSISGKHVLRNPFFPGDPAQGFNQNAKQFFNFNQGPKIARGFRLLDTRRPSIDQVQLVDVNSPRLFGPDLGNPSLPQQLFEAIPNQELQNPGGNSINEISL